MDSGPCDPGSGSIASIRPFDRRCVQPPLTGRGRAHIRRHGIGTSSQVPLTLESRVLEKNGMCPAIVSPSAPRFELRPSMKRAAERRDVRETSRANDLPSIAGSRRPAESAVAQRRLDHQDCSAPCMPLRPNLESETWDGFAGPPILCYKRGCAPVAQWIERCSGAKVTGSIPVGRTTVLRPLEPPMRPEPAPPTASRRTRHAHGRLFDDVSDRYDS